MDKDLAARLGVATSVAIAPYLGNIHDQIMGVDGPNSVRATIAMKFSIDEEGLIHVDVQAKIPMQSLSRVIRLRSSKGQLSLFDAVTKKRTERDVEKLGDSGSQ